MRGIVSFIIFLLVFPALAFGVDGEDAPYALKVYYLEFPPYYFTNADHEPDGFLLKKADTVFRRAGIEPSYESIPAKRVLQDMRTLRPICSIGWFKTPEREKFAKFSTAIYQNKPVQLLYLKKNSSQFSHMETLAQVLGDASLVLGMLEGYSLGPTVDALIMEGKPQSQIVVGGYPQLVRMLAAERFSYTLIAPEEIDVLVEMNRLAPDLFERKELRDIPAGNIRYLMFSRGVPDEIVARVTRALRESE